ncbi:shikimate O-hydroxycinnamoyltransferase [Sarracenia purpurea var. burkii]
MENEGDRFRIVNQVREAIRKVDGDYVRMLRGEDNHLKFLKEGAKNFKTGEVVSFSFSSLCRFPLYEADFGWGKPAWVALASMPFKNVVMFMETQSGDGIEAWVNLKDEDMAKFQVDKELLAFVEG